VKKTCGTKSAFVLRRGLNKTVKNNNKISGNNRKTFEFEKDFDMM
jgi:hypothetical protein